MFFFLHFFVHTHLTHAESKSWIDSYEMWKNVSIRQQNLLWFVFMLRTLIINGFNENFPNLNGVHHMVASQLNSSSTMFSIIITKKTNRVNWLSVCCYPIHSSISCMYRIWTFHFIWHSAIINVSSVVMNTVVKRHMKIVLRLMNAVIWVFTLLRWLWALKW